MVQLIWGVLNLLLVLGFFYLLIGLLIKGRKFLKPYPMFLTVPILIFGFTGILNSTAGKQKPVKTYNGKATVEIIDVSKNLANKIQLHLVKDTETGKIIKESSYSSLQGFVMGLEWQHLELLEHKNEIEVSGILKYKFMGNDIISSFESFVLKDFNPDFN